MGRKRKHRDKDSERILRKLERELRKRRRYSTSSASTEGNSGKCLHTILFMVLNLKLHVCTLTVTLQLPI